MPRPQRATVAHANVVVNRIRKAAGSRKSEVQAVNLTSHPEFVANVFVHWVAPAEVGKKTGLKGLSTKHRTIPTVLPRMST
jgi:hypothetical protein